MGLDKTKAVCYSFLIGLFICGACRAQCSGGSCSGNVNFASVGYTQSYNQASFQTWSYQQPVNVYAFQRPHVFQRIWQRVSQRRADRQNRFSCAPVNSVATQSFSYLQCSACTSVPVTTYVSDGTQAFECTDCQSSEVTSYASMFGFRSDTSGPLSNQVAVLSSEIFSPF